MTLTNVANDIFSTRQQIEKMIDERADVKLHKRLSALAGAPTEARNPFAELNLSVFANEDGIELISSVDLLGRSYQTQVAIPQDFRLRKEKLFEIYEAATERIEGKDGLATYRIPGEKSVILADREAQAETIAQGLLEIVVTNSLRVFQLAGIYDRLTTTSLEELRLPRVELVEALKKFPDLDTLQ